MAAERALWPVKPVVEWGLLGRHEQRCHSSASTQAPAATPELPEQSRGVTPLDFSRPHSSLDVPLAGLSPVYGRKPPGGRSVLSPGLREPQLRAPTPESPEALAAEALATRGGRAQTATPGAKERFAFTVPVAPPKERPAVAPRRPGTSQGFQAAAPPAGPASGRGTSCSTRGPTGPASGRGASCSTRGAASPAPTFPVEDPEEVIPVTSWARAETHVLSPPLRQWARAPTGYEALQRPPPSSPPAVSSSSPAASVLARAAESLAATDCGAATPTEAARPITPSRRPLSGRASLAPMVARAAHPTAAADRGPAEPSQPSSARPATSAGQALGTSSLASPDADERSREGAQTQRLARTWQSTPVEMPPVLAELKRKPWKPELWLRECEKAVAFGGPPAAMAFVRCAQAATAQAIAQRGYEMAPKAPHEHRGIARGPYINLGNIMQGHPRIEWYSRRNVPTAPRLKGHTRQVLLLQDSPLDIVVDFKRRDTNGHHIVMVAELNSFDSSGSPDLRGSNCVNPPDLLMRTDFGRFVEASTKESQRCSRWAVHDHLGSHTDPYMLWCEQVTIFRGPREEGYPFLEEPVQVTVLVTSMASQRPPIQFVNFRRQGKTEWFQDSTEHSALLQRLDMIGQLAGKEVKCDDDIIRKPLLVMCALGSGSDGRQPMDAMASSMKHWRKHYGCNFFRVCVCCRGRGGGDLELERHFGMLVNNKVGSETATRPVSRALTARSADEVPELGEEAEEEEMQEEHLDPEYRKSSFERIVEEDASGSIDFRGLAADARGNAAPGDGGNSSDSDVDMEVDIDDVAKQNDLDQRRFFDHERARIKEHHNELGGIVTGLFLTVKGYKKSREVKSCSKRLEKQRSSSTCDGKTPRKGGLGSQDVTPMEREAPRLSPVRSPSLGSDGSDRSAEPSPVPEEAAAKKPPAGRRSSMPALRGGRRKSDVGPLAGDAGRQAAKPRRKSCEVDDRGKGRSYGAWESAEMQEKVAQLKAFRSRLMRRASDGGLQKIARRMSDNSFFMSFREHFLGGRGEMVAVETSAIEKRRNSMLGKLPDGMRSERRGSFGHVVTDQQLQTRMEARERLRRPSVRTVAAQEEKEERRRRLSGVVTVADLPPPGQPLPGLLPAAPSSTPAEPSRAAPSPASPVAAQREMVHRHERLNFISHAFQESIMATSHLSETTMKSWKDEAAERKKLEASITELTASLEKAFERHYPTH